MFGRRKIQVKSDAELALMARAGVVTSRALDAAVAAAVPGATTADLDRAFRAVLEDGRAGALFETGNSDSLARTLIDLLTDRDRLEELAASGARSSAQYDWEVVADKVFEVYKLAIDMGSPADSGTRRARDLIRGRDDEEEES